MSFVWSVEAVERLKALHAQGLSGSELASRLGGGLTRSAIFGKLHRLGLTGKTGEPKRRPRSPITCHQAARGWSRGGPPWWNISWRPRNSFSAREAYSAEARNQDLDMAEWCISRAIAEGGLSPPPGADKPTGRSAKPN